MHDYIENIVHSVVHQMGESATAPISALPVRLAMLSTALTHPCVHSISMSYTKKLQGLAIALFFSYAKRTGKTNLYAVQLRILGLSLPGFYIVFFFEHVNVFI